MGIHATSSYPPALMLCSTHTYSQMCVCSCWRLRCKSTAGWIGFQWRQPKGTNNRISPRRQASTQPWNQHCQELARNSQQVIAWRVLRAACWVCFTLYLHPGALEWHPGSCQAGLARHSALSWVCKLALGQGRYILWRRIDIMLCSHDVWRSYTSPRDSDSLEESWKKNSFDTRRC